MVNASTDGSAVGTGVEVDIGVGVEAGRGAEQAESSIRMIENPPSCVSEDMKTPDTILITMM
jgi:hypothetical protein